MTYQVIVEPTADEGIRESCRWIAEHGSAAAAVKWLDSIEKTIFTLRTLPYRCPVAAENDRFSEEIRELLHGKRPSRYRVLFTIRDDAVHVLYVRHHAQNEVEP